MPDYDVAASRAVPTFLRSICWNGVRIFWCAILILCEKRCVPRKGSGRFISMAGWCCPTMCIACGPCRRAIPIFPTAGRRSRFASCELSLRSRTVHRSGQSEVKGASGSVVSGSTPFATKRTLPGISIRSITIRSDTDGQPACGTGPIPPFIAMCKEASILLTGPGGEMRS